MKNSAAPEAKHRRKIKYFDLQETDSRGLDNAYWIKRTKKCYQLIGNEVGNIGTPEPTIPDALNADGNQYGGEFIEIQTNIRLDELLEAFATPAFGPLLNNFSTIVINEVEMDADQFKAAVEWYRRYWDKIKNFSESSREPTSRSIAPA